MTGMVKPLLESDISKMDLSNKEVCGVFVLTHTNACLCIECLDIWIFQQLSNLEEDIVRLVVVVVAKIFVNATNGSYEVVANQDSENNTTNEFPPVLPHQLVKLDLRGFNNIMSAHVSRLEKKLSPPQIHLLGKDFVGLLRAYQEEKFFKEGVDACSDNAAFIEGWKVVDSRFLHLR